MTKNHTEVTVEEKKIVVSESTLLPLSLVCGVIGIIIVGVIRVETIGSRADSGLLIGSTHASEIKSLQDEDKKIISLQNDLMIELSTRLARIEGAVGLPEYKTHRSLGGTK